MPAFKYSPGNLIELERTLSLDRLRPYQLSVASKDCLDDIKTGGWNLSQDKHGRCLFMVHAVSGV